MKRIEPTGIMTKEFCLSNNLMRRKDCKGFWAKDEDIKKFIRELNIYICSKLEGQMLLKKKDLRELYAEIEKLAGKKLI